MGCGGAIIIGWRSFIEYAPGEAGSVHLCPGQHCGGESFCEGPLLHAHTEGQEDDNDIFCGEHRLTEE